MYAIFDNGNKQYKASVGDTVKVEKLNAEVGATVTFPVVLLADEKSVLVGKEVEKQVVTAEVLAHGKDKKIIVFKYKAKKNERKKQGHRQPYSSIKVTAIGAPEVKAKAKKAEPKVEETPEIKVEAPVKEKAAPKKTAPKTTAPKAEKAEGAEAKAAAPKTTAKKTTKAAAPKATAKKTAEDKAE